MLITIALLLTILMLLVVYFDATNFIIPNWVNGAVLGLFPLFLLITPIEIEWWMSLLTLVLFFAIGLGIFSLNIMGGGDIKLFIAISPWLGWDFNTIFKFIILFSFSGGIIAIFLLAARAFLRKTYGAKRVNKEFPKVFRWEGKITQTPIPYGLAIAFAFGYLIWTNNIYGLIIS